MPHAISIAQIQLKMISELQREVNELHHDIRELKGQR